MEGKESRSADSTNIEADDREDKEDSLWWKVGFMYHNSGTIPEHFWGQNLQKELNLMESIFKKACSSLAASAADSKVSSSPAQLSCSFSLCDPSWALITH